MDKFKEYSSGTEELSELTAKEQQDLAGGWEPLFIILIEKVKDYFGFGEQNA